MFGQDSPGDLVPVVARSFRYLEEIAGIAVLIFLFFTILNNKCKLWDIGDLKDLSYLLCKSLDFLKTRKIKIN